MAEATDPRIDRFERYLDALLAGERPSPDDVVDAEEAEVARLAAELAGGLPGASADPDPAFVEQLRLRMREADQGIAAVRARPSTVKLAGFRETGKWRLTRRQLLQAGAGVAAGLAAGLTGVSLSRRDAPAAVRDDPELVTGDGRWVEVGSVDDVPPGSALRFSTAAFDGFVVNDGGDIRALSSACTHMGCTLRFRPDHGDLRCPCHGARFDLAGRLANGPPAWSSGGSYGGDTAAYPVALPDLVRPRVKVQDGRILVWTARI